MSEMKLGPGEFMQHPELWCPQSQGVLPNRTGGRIKLTCPLCGREGVTVSRKGIVRMHAPLNGTPASLRQALELRPTTEHETRRRRARASAPVMEPEIVAPSNGVVADEVEQEPALEEAPPRPEGPRVYRVIWEIDVEASGPLAAAVQAVITQRDPDSTANVFRIYEAEYETPDDAVEIDLMKLGVIVCESCGAWGSQEHTEDCEFA